MYAAANEESESGNLTARNAPIEIIGPVLKLVTFSRPHDVKAAVERAAKVRAKPHPCLYPLVVYGKPLAAVCG